MAAPPKLPARSAERVQLAEAIEQLGAARARRATLETALETAEASVWQASAAVEAAEADVEQSKTDAAEYLLAVAAGRGGDVPRSTRAARDKLTDATDALDAARSARDALKQQMTAPANIDAWTMRVNSAIDAVLRSEAAHAAQAVIDQANTAKAELVRCIMLVQFLDGRVFERNSVNAIAHLSQYPLTDNYDRAREQATARWRGVVEALAADPDAVVDLA
jgi:hypothetical protein